MRQPGRVGENVLWQRIISALVGIPLILIAVWYGGAALLILIGIITILGIREMMQILARLGLKPVSWLGVIGGLILLGGTYLHTEGYPVSAITIILFLHLIATVVFYPGYSLLDSAGTLMSTLYVGLLSYLYLIRSLPDGAIWLLYMLLCTWACDTLAYIFGMSFGKRKIVPRLSPNKTLAGSLGGLAGSILTSLIFAYIYPFLSMPKLLLLGLLVGLAAEVGDLLESAFKRQAGVKDTSMIIPGHGGILDRFDSSLFTAPLVYNYVLLFLI